MKAAKLTRRCRECGKLWHLDPNVTVCPTCGAAFGRLVLGLDVDPAAAEAMERVRLADTESTYIRKMDETLRRAKPTPVDPQPAPQPRPEETA